jgi:hypothetical protein
MAMERTALPRLETAEEAQEGDRSVDRAQDAGGDRSAPLRLETIEEAQEGEIGSSCPMRGDGDAKPEIGEKAPPPAEFSPRRP